MTDIDAIPPPDDDLIDRIVDGSFDSLPSSAPPSTASIASLTAGSAARPRFSKPSAGASRSVRWAEPAGRQAECEAGPVPPSVARPRRSPRRWARAAMAAGIVGCFVRDGLAGPCVAADDGGRAHHAWAVECNPHSACR